MCLVLFANSILIVAIATNKCSTRVHLVDLNALHVNKSNFIQTEMSFLRQKINFKDLEEELQSAVKADELYKLQNDAKLRAVEQNVPSYEQFRQMVNAAHLKPMDKKKMGNSHTKEFQEEN